MDVLSSCRASSEPSLPFLPDDLLLEILQRLPPEPIHVLHASLVSQRWRRLVHDAIFLRRFRAFHGAPPVIGFLNSQPGHPLFVPTSGAFAVPSTMTTDSWWPLDCRHGRALLVSRPSWEIIVVWDPMSGEKRCLSPLPLVFDDVERFNGAVLRAAGNDDDRIGCRSCPFLVALAFTQNDLTSVCVYSSETGIWGDATSVATLEDLEMYPTALVGKALLYWQLTAGSILEFDLEKHSLDVIEEVPQDVFAKYEGEILLMPAEDGGIGFAGVDDLSLHLFSRVPSIIDGTLEWTLRRTIDLKKFLAPDVVLRRHTCPAARAIGFDEDADVIFIYVDRCVYMLHLKSMQFDEVSERGIYRSVHPYSSFYTAALP